MGEEMKWKQIMEKKWKRIVINSEGQKSKK